MSAIENGSVRNIEMMHEFRNVALRGGYQYLEMIRHANICQEGNIVDL